MAQTDITASPTLRILFAAMAASMFALWAWSLVPAIENWNNPSEDGFSLVPVFYATPTTLPIGLVLLAGAVAGRGRSVARARMTMFLGVGLLAIVVAFLIVQQIANSNDGKVFGIQIGFMPAAAIAWRARRCKRRPDRAPGRTR